MTSHPLDAATSDRLLSSSAVVGLAARLLRAHLDELTPPDRAPVLEVLVRRADDVAAALDELVGDDAGPMQRAGERRRVAALERAAQRTTDRIEALEAAALDSEAAALVSDARILQLAAEVDRLMSTRDQAAAIEEAKRALMGLMQISEDAAFALLVAAAQRDGATVHAVAQRMARFAGAPEGDHAPPGADG